VAIRRGSTIPLNFSGGKNSGRLFYYGLKPGAEDFYEERLLVYDRAGEPCFRCSTPIRRIVQAARSTFYCPCCQRSAS
jgi:formamidopyrimidine-DNA glycosylase